MSKVLKYVADTSRNQKLNFAFKASFIWNAQIEKLLNKYLPNPKGIIIPGLQIALIYSQVFPL